MPPALNGNWNPTSEGVNGNTPGQFVQASIQAHTSSPPPVFDPTLADVARFTKKPVIICETASSERGGNKAQWIHQFFAFVESTPAVTGFAWFDSNKESNWLVNSSPAALVAFQLT
jgi:hypothetical protein